MLRNSHILSGRISALQLFTPYPVTSRSAIKPEAEEGGMQSQFPTWSSSTILWALVCPWEVVGGCLCFAYCFFLFSSPMKLPLYDPGSSLAVFALPISSGWGKWVSSSMGTEMLGKASQPGMWTKWVKHTSPKFKELLAFTLLSLWHRLWELSSLITKTISKHISKSYLNPGAVEDVVKGEVTCCKSKQPASSAAAETQNFIGHSHPCLIQWLK